MSQRDLAAELRAARIATPSHVREQVRLIAAAATPPTRRFSLTWRRALVVALPAAAALAAVAVVARPTSNHTATPQVELQAQARDSATTQHGALAAPPQALSKSAGSAAATAPSPSATRAQNYSAYLSLRIPTATGVSNGVKRALSIASSLGGYPVKVHASTETPAATADLTLKVPRSRVAEAISRLSALGTIVGEQVDVQDAQAGINTTDRQIARLQRRLADLRAQNAQTDDVKRQIASLTALVERLQRKQAATLRATRYATIDLHLGTKPVATPTKHGHGPLHGLGVAFRWIGIGGIYALALGVPFLILIVLCWLAARTVRRRRVDALLNQA